MKAIGAAVLVVGVFASSSAYAQKVMIVKDGTVDLTATGGLGNKNAHKPDKQKWNVKAVAVQLLYGDSPQNACQTELKGLAEFDTVRFQVRFAAFETIGKFPVIAENEGFLFKHLFLEFPGKSPYSFRQQPGNESYQLYDDNQKSNAFELEDIEVRYKDGAVVTASRDEGRTRRYLCAKFLDKHARRAAPRK
jgi:hypothetical protein